MYEKKVRYVSYGLLLTSGLGILAALHFNFAAYDLVHHMFGKSEYVSREEFDAYDATKLGAGLMLFGCLLSAMMGKCGVMASHGHKCKWAYHKRSERLCRLLKGTFINAALVALCLVGIHQQGGRVFHDKQLHDFKTNKTHQPMPEFPHHESRRSLESLEDLRTMDMELIHPAVRSSWFSGLSSWSNWSMKDVIDKLKKMCFDAMASRFAPADDDSTCSVHKEDNSCNAANQCSWCATRSDKAMELSSDCRKTENAMQLPPDAWNCSKISPEIKNATRRRLGQEFADAMKMDFFSDMAIRCTHKLWTNEAGCKADPDCVMCGPSEGMKSFIKVEKHKEPKCIPRMNALAIPSMFTVCDGIDSSEHTWMTTFVSRLSYWAAFGSDSTDKRMLFGPRGEEWEPAEEPEHKERHQRKHHGKGHKKSKDDKKPKCKWCFYAAASGLVHAVLMIAQSHFIRHLKLAVEEDESKVAEENQSMVSEPVMPVIFAPVDPMTGSVNAPVTIN